MDIASNPQIFDVDMTNFEEKVLQGSQEQIVVVDFWAPWCGPCKTLGPILEEVITDLGQGIVLAKVNVDDNPQLAQAFRVQGIPAVKIVSNGQLVDEFTGALPKEEIEAKLRPLVPGAGPSEEELLAEARKNEAEHRAAGGNLDEAAQLYEQQVADNPEDGEAQIALGTVYLQQGAYDKVQTLVEKVSEENPVHDRVQALLTQVDIYKTGTQSGGRAACAERLLATPDDLDARYALGCSALVGGDIAEALKEWLAVVEKKRDHAAKEAMVSVFHILGRQHEAVADYPQRLYRTLY